MWHHFFVAISLVLVIEGILPFLSPAQFRQSLLKMLELDDKTIRMIGFIAMLSGVTLLYWIN